ncbi:hypothetical protein NUW58_g6302 [Xylaria curta]|uniref:Uncharacterized protein n=1 Tax=Xylaria curta TaxID=42375 RepID=A0ACC1NWF0_9PEZI|nr:hypothetical protein NUW58_g6302 [Xylaria curta]
MASATNSKAETSAAKHARPFAYKNGESVRPFLQPYAYKARDLMNCTVASFYELSDDQLAPHQRRAKEGFIKLFNRRLKVPTAELHETRLYSTLKKLMRHIDEFFFFGSLTHDLQSPIRRLALTHFPPEADLLGRCCLINTDDGLPGFEISLEKYEDYKGHKLVDLPNLVHTLIHELTHAFLEGFCCHCSQCKRNDINAVGMEFTGHGPIFRGMHYAVMVCMADWSAELDKVSRGCSNDTYIETFSLSAEKSEIEDMEKNGTLKKMGMRPYIRNPSRRLLIWTSEHRIFIDVKRLRTHVRRTAMSVSATSAKRTSTKRKRDDEGPFVRNTRVQTEDAVTFLRRLVDLNSRGEERFARVPELPWWGRDL